jgi:hypothetical protein
MPDALDLVDEQVDGSVGLLEQLLVAWKARISAYQACTVRASRDGQVRQFICWAWGAGNPLVTFA